MYSFSPGRWICEITNQWSRESSCLPKVHWDHTSIILHTLLNWCDAVWLQSSCVMFTATFIRFLILNISCWDETKHEWHGLLFSCYSHLPTFRVQLSFSSTRFWIFLGVSLSCPDILTTADVRIWLCRQQLCTCPLSEVVGLPGCGGEQAVVCGLCIWIVLHRQSDNVDANIHI